MSAVEVRSLRHRFQILLVLRFVPTGLFATVFVLLFQERGLTLADIGLATAAQGIVMLFLELPSGGLADALGRRPVLLLATGVSLVASGLFLAADSVAVLALASALQGVFRALDSGPLQAWFIDASLAADPDADVERGLSVETVVICLSIGAGALLAGGLVALGGIGGLDPLETPLAVGLVVQALALVAIALLMDEHRTSGGWGAARRSVATVPAVTRDALALIRRRRLLVALVAAELLWGFGMISFQVLLPPRLAEVAGDADRAAELLGPAVTAAWGLSALGAAAAPWLVRRWGSAWAGFGLRVAHGLTVAAMGLAGGVPGVLAAYLATYGVHGAAAPVHYGMVHRAVDAGHRATVVSANSLTSQVGSALGGIVLGLVADHRSVTTAIVVGAVVLAAAAPLYLVDRGRVATAVPLAP